MNFTLFYSGRIRSSNKRNVKHINDIRCKLSPQIRQLYDCNPLKSIDAKCEPGSHTAQDVRTYTKIAGRDYSSLVNKGLGLACQINVIFYEATGTISVANDIGDVDNKAKTLIDALKLPSNDEVDKLSDELMQSTVHCLLMDDAFLWGVDLKRRRLLHPELRKEKTLTQIDVQVMPTSVTIANIGLFGVPVF